MLGAPKCFYNSLLNLQLSFISFLKFYVGKLRPVLKVFSVYLVYMCI
jgi:hypothetical protein